MSVVENLIQLVHILGFNFLLIQILNFYLEPEYMEYIFLP